MRSIPFFILIFLIKFSFSQGGFEGAYNIDALPLFHNHGVEIIETHDHNYICTSYHKDHGASPVIAGLTKISSLGNIIWKKYISIPCGGPDITALGVVELKDGNYLLYGEGDILCFSPYNFSVAYFIKTDTSGNIIWSKNFGGNGYVAYVNQLVAASDTGFIICGEIPPYGSCLAKFNIDGDSIWTKFYLPIDSSLASGSNSYQNSLIQVVENNDQSISALGIYNFQPIILNTDNAGDSLSAFTFPDSSCQCSNAITHFIPIGNKSFICVVAKVDTNSLQTIKSFYILSDSLGNLIWKRGDNSVPLITSLSYFSDSTIIYFGDSSCMNNFGIPYQGFTKINSQANILWNECLNNQYNIFPWGLIGGIKLHITNDHCILMTGSIDSTNQNAYESIYYLKLDSAGNILAVINDIRSEQPIISLFPNPASENIFISTPIKISQLKIFDILGKELISQSILGKNREIDIHSLSDGIYFLQIQTEQGSLVNKFIKE